ncbi:hypothetical protein Slin15195_G021660 [Septoria linicola]|uniref:Uncharacterized protein n=1 Tax=Septoria linicola TaxID=215465 RepID=A0A9Q9AGR6_9PEZI|nr:hypothetical protein Slin15195_G021660 [Septoria linicola]
MINVVEVSRVELDFADGALVPGALYSWLPTLEVCLRWNSSTDRFISPSQADIIAQMLSGDVDTTWRELCTAHAQGRFEHSERMDAVHRYIVCMRAARMTVDYLDQQNGPIAFSHEAPWNFKVLGGILPYGLASVVKADLGEYCPSKMSIDKLFWIMRDLLYQAGDGDRVLATDQASAAMTDSSQIRDSAEQLAVEYILREVAEHLGLMRSQVLQRYELKDPRQAEPVVVPTPQPAGKKPNTTVARPGRQSQLARLPRRAHKKQN